MSEDIMDTVSFKNSTKLYQMQGILSEDNVNQAWSAFGNYISKQLRTGRAIKIKDFGLFTFSLPEVNLAGTTNPQIRD